MTSSMFSPLSLKRLAKESGQVCFRGEFQVDPEGNMYLGNKRCTLNEAIIYAGKLSLQQVSA